MNLSYTMIHLKNGMTIYTEDKFDLKELEHGESSFVLGMDGQRYDLLDDEIAVVHFSTPESRQKLVALQMALKFEATEFQESYLMAIKKQADDFGMSERAVDRVASRLGNQGPKLDA